VCYYKKVYYIQASKMPVADITTKKLICLPIYADLEISVVDFLIPAPKF
jgi:dTDP-4-amino-4,6-dideoxygalactose transaminase